MDNANAIRQPVGDSERAEGRNRAAGGSRTSDPGRQNAHYQNSGHDQFGDRVQAGNSQSLTMANLKAHEQREERRFGPFQIPVRGREARSERPRMHYYSSTLDRWLAERVDEEPYWTGRAGFAAGEGSSEEDKKAHRERTPKE